MEITITEKNRSIIVKPVGEIDHHTSVELRQKVERAFNRTKARNIIFDFSSVTFMDSSGIGIIIGRYKELAKLGGKVYAIGVAGGVDRIFNLSGLTRIIPCYKNLDEALTKAGEAL